MKPVKRHVISVALVLLVMVGLVGGTYFAGMKPKLGLDLRGGLSVTLTAPPGTRSDLLDKAVETLRGRVDRAGVAEPEISREGSNNILIQLPGAGDSARLLKLIGRTAQLQFRQVLEQVSKGDPKYEEMKLSTSDDPSEELVLPGKEPGTKFRVTKAEVKGDAVRKALARPPSAESASWDISVNFKKAGAKRWQALTGRLACLQGVQRQIAIVLDGRVESHVPPAEDVKCNEGIGGGTTVITGSFTDVEAKDLALVLTAGALPVKLDQSEVRTVSPTLGSDSLRAGLLAGALGLILVFLYVLIYYRSLGLQTWFGLLVFASIIYGLIVAFGGLIGWSLTLSGIAGLIVSIGIATDSYIVFFERVKEEIHHGRSLKASIDKGFEHAWRTMRTANTVTILAAIVLYVLAVGPVRGFALALGMATTIDLAVTYGLTWPLAALLARNKFFSDNRVLGMRGALEGGKKQGSILRKIYRSEFNIDFIGRRKLWLTISAFLLASSIILLIPSIRGLTYGIDFKGGTVYRAPAEASLTVPAVKSALNEAGLGNPLVQIQQDKVSKRSLVQVQTESTLKPADRDKVISALAKATGTKLDSVNIESVGSKWGAQITIKALRGLLIFLVLVILYMSWRLEPKMAAAGIAALIHDVTITAGVYALVGFEVSPATVVATLTILGYSLYDTVVVFDKIRENQALPSNSRLSFNEIANVSTNQVFMRSINTSLTVLLPVGSLLVVGSVVLGADTLKDLALALFVGIAAGTFSSIYVATPLLTIWKQHEPRYANVRERVVSESRGKSKAIPALGADADSAEEKTPALARAGSARPTESGSSGDGSSASAARPAPSPRRQPQQRRQSRAKRKKAKRT
ncbi:MAG: protein translocase subunit SecD [Actinomycetota bacterium]